MQSTSHDPVPPDPPTPTAPTPNMMQELSMGRSQLAKAFKFLLIVVHFPVLAGLLCFVNLFSYWEFFVKNRPHLCNITRHCDTLMGLSLILSPFTLLFILVALFILDRYLSLSPVFNQLETPTSTLPNSNDDSVEQSAAHRTSEQVLNGYGSGESLSLTVLRTLSIASCVLSIFWMASLLTAIAGASLVLKLDSPFDPNAPDGKALYKERVIVGFSEGAFDALLAYYTGRAACAMSRARQSVLCRAAGGMEARAQSVVRTQREGLLYDGSACNQRSTLDKAVLRPLLSLTLSFVCGILLFVYDTFSHLRHIKGSPYFCMCLITSLFTWFVTLVFHRYRSYGAFPGAVFRTFVSLISILVATLWLLASGTYLFLCIGALFCDEHVPLPHNSPCSYIRTSGTWSGFAEIAFGYLQAFLLGGTALLSWESRGGIRLTEEDGEEDVVVGQVSAV